MILDFIYCIDCFFLLVWGIGFDVVIIVIVIFDLPMEFHCNRHTQPVMEQWKQRNDYSALVNGEGARTYRFRHIGTVGFHLEEKKEKGWKMPRPWTMFDAPPSLSSFPVEAEKTWPFPFFRWWEVGRRRVERREGGREHLNWRPAFQSMRLDGGSGRRS